jgi:triosephosphate isomerase
LKLVLNLKTYSGTFGTNLEQFLDSLPDLEHLVVCPQHTDIFRATNTEISTYAQHVSPQKPGRNTGSNLAEAVAEAGADGTLINHSEHRLKDNEIEAAVEKATKAGLQTVVCAETPSEAEQYSRLEVDSIALEIPTLIAGDKSIAQAEPGQLQEAVNRSSVPVLAGAGVSNPEDVKKAAELGSEGVLVASAVAKATNPAEKVQELYQSLN